MTTEYIILWQDGCETDDGLLNTGFVITKKLIRCRNCKHYNLDDSGYYGYCDKYHATFCVDDFCSYGEEKEDAHSSYDKS